MVAVYLRGRTARSRGGAPRVSSDAGGGGAREEAEAAQPGRRRAVGLRDHVAIRRGRPVDVALCETRERLGHGVELAELGPRLVPVRRVARLRLLVVLPADARPVGLLGALQDVAAAAAALQRLGAHVEVEERRPLVVRLQPREPHPVGPVDRLLDVHAHQGAVLDVLDAVAAVEVRAPVRRHAPLAQHLLAPGLLRRQRLVPLPGQLRVRVLVVRPILRGVGEGHHQRLGPAASGAERSLAPGSP